MKILRTAAELKWPVSPIGFVPTMGALHEGHLSLMGKAKATTGFCVASIFVNPTQFGAGEDFDKYPRNEEHDFELARSAGADAIYAPSVDEMYRDSRTTVTVSGVADMWEGALRPGHFDGVATVVAKLFGMVGPCHAFFGQKDYQQCRVIDKMVRDLHLPVNLHFEETVREADGLAMSSRNVYLSPTERAIAPALYHTLKSCRDNIHGGEDVKAALDKGIADLTIAGYEVQYLAAVDELMQPIWTPAAPSRLIVAAKLGKTRLIDNIPLFS
jgi:pantoate--beta-alanine ligase